MANLGDSEIWCELEWTRHRTFVSSHGRLYRLSKPVYEHVKYMRLGERCLILNPAIGRTSRYNAGYKLSTLLTKEGKVRNIYVHRLVAETFIPNPENKPQVNHIDGNTLNNRVDNLEWSTSKENINHAWDNGLCSPSKKRITPELIKSVRELSSNGFNQGQISRALNINQSNISRIINYKRRFAI